MNGFLAVLSETGRNLHTKVISITSHLDWFSATIHRPFSSLDRGSTVIRSIHEISLVALAHVVYP
jgi:hypothetical protein